MLAVEKDDAPANLPPEVADAVILAELEVHLIPRVLVQANAHIWLLRGVQDQPLYPKVGQRVVYELRVPPFQVSKVE